VNPLVSFTLDWVRLNDGLWEEEFPGIYRVVLGHALPQIGGLSLITDDPEMAARSPRTATLIDALPRASLRPVSEVFATATEEARSKLGASLQAKNAALGARKALDKSRAERYFDDLLHEADEDLTAARDASRRAALELRRQSILTERGRAFDEIESRHRLSMSLDLGSILVLAHPKIRIDCNLVHKKGWTAKLPLLWNPLLAEVEPADCPQCRKPSHVFDLSRDGVRCSTCVGNRS
jgi:hypothetical protein